MDHSTYDAMILFVRLFYGSRESCPVRTTNICIMTILVQIRFTTTTAHQLELRESGVNRDQSTNLNIGRRTREGMLNTVGYKITERKYGTLEFIPKKLT